MDCLPEHLRERISLDYVCAVKERCKSLVTGMDHCGLLETCQECKKLRRGWLSLRKEMLSVSEYRSMREILLWMINIDKTAKLLASWIEKKNQKYTEHLELAKSGNARASSKGIFERIASMHINNFALSKRTSKDMIMLMSRLPKDSVIRMFTQTQQDACTLFARALRRLPNILQTLDLGSFPSKRELSMLGCSDAQRALLAALRF